jgi:hypothetical protein
MDHYRCNLYFIPETRAYRISGSTKLFQQHCQLPNLVPHQHFSALTEELADSTAIVSAMQKGRQLIKLLQENIKKILNPTSALEEQRVRDNDIQMQQQRVIDNTPIITAPLMPRITNAPPVLQARNPTAKRTLKDTPRVHQQVTLNNTLCGVPKIIRPSHAPPHCACPQGSEPRSYKLPQPRQLRPAVNSCVHLLNKR